LFYYTPYGFIGQASFCGGLLLPSLHAIIFPISKTVLKIPETAGKVIQPPEKVLQEAGKVFREPVTTLQLAGEVPQEPVKVTGAAVKVSKMAGH
jgi:hypothetical protein